MELVSKEQMRKYSKEGNLKDLADVQAMVKELFASAVQEMLVAEMDTHLGYAKHDTKNKQTENSRNGHAVLDQLQSFIQFAVALDWNVSASDHCVHAWLPDRKGKSIQPIIRAEHSKKGKRLKFRINQEDRKRLQVLAYALGVTKVDGLWSVLFPLTLLDGRSLWNLTNSRDVIVRGFHPLRQERLTAKSWDNYRGMEGQA